MDSIQSHAGSAENATFEMKWKSGDITWMPYYQIRHLQALDAYFDLLGVKNTAELPAGKGNPPQEDPQVFLGAISLCPSFSNPLQQSLQFRDSFSFYTNPPLLPSSNHSYFQQPIQFLDQQSFSDNPCTTIQILSLYFDDYFICSSSFFLFDYIDLFSEHIDTLTPVTNFPPGFSDSHFDMRHLLSIQHPRFLRLSKTEYAIDNPDSRHRWYVHVGQIMNYLAFDKVLREGGNVSDFLGIPLGFFDFATAFNTGMYPGDKRFISTYTIGVTTDLIIKSELPVYLEDFFITPEQCGLSPPRRDEMTEGQAFVFKAYATGQALKTEKSANISRLARTNTICYLVVLVLIRRRAIDTIL